MVNGQGVLAIFAIPQTGFCSFVLENKAFFVKAAQRLHEVLHCQASCFYASSCENFS